LLLPEVIVSAFLGGCGRRQAMDFKLFTCFPGTPTYQHLIIGDRLSIFQELLCIDTP